MYQNYPFNPYMGQQMYKPMEQSVQPQTMPQMANIGQRNCLVGKVVANEQIASSIDIPLDGSCSYFPLADGSKIITKQIQLDGTSKTIVYVPLNEETKNVPEYATIEDLDKAINKIDLSDIEDLKEELKDIKSEIKELKKKKKDD